MKAGVGFGTSGGPLSGQTRRSGVHDAPDQGPTFHHSTTPIRLPRGRTALLFALATLSAGCWAKNPPYPAEPIALQYREPQPSEAYQIRPGDVIAVKFYSTPQYNEDSLLVRPDGSVSLPYVGDIRVAGRSTAQIEADLRQRYSSELAPPRNGESMVTVIVRQLGSYQVHVGGEVARDGRVLLRGNLTVLEAIQRAGGFLDTADPEHVVIIRNEGEHRRTGYVVDLEQVIDGSNPSQDVALEPSDIVYVPRSTIASLNLIVEQYIRKMLPLEYFPIVP